MMFREWCQGRGPAIFRDQCASLRWDPNRFHPFLTFFGIGVPPRFRRHHAPQGDTPLIPSVSVARFDELTPPRTPSKRAKRAFFDIRRKLRYIFLVNSQGFLNFHVLTCGDAAS
jgi:hypothetical protein